MVHNVAEENSQTESYIQQQGSSIPSFWHGILHLLDIIALLAISALVIMVSKELHLISVVGRLPPFIPFLDLNTFLSIVFETNLCKSIGAYFAIKEEVRLRGMRVVIGDCSDGL